MKKSNVILQAAIASALFAMAGSATAGTLSTANTAFATELFKAGATDVVLTPGAITYSTSSSITANPGTPLYFLVRLENGTFTGTPGVAEFKLGGVVAGAAANATAPGLVVTPSTDKTTLELAFTTMTGSTTLLGLSAMTWTPAAGTVTGSNAVLSTAGSTINATSVLTLSATASYEATDALPTSVDLPTATGTVATSTKAIAGAVSALSGYTAQIDLTASPTASLYTIGVTPVTTTAGVALGSVTFTTTAGRKNAATTADYTLELDSASTASAATITVTPGTGEAFPIGAVLRADITANTCLDANAVGALAAVTATDATTAKTITVPNTSVTSGTEIFVCMTEPSAGNTAAPITATLSAATVPPTAADQTVTASGTGYALGYNGQTRNVQLYVPASKTGFAQNIRVVNTGAVAAPVSVAMYGEDGTLHGSYTTASLAAGESTRITQGVLEAGVGYAPAATERPRLVVTSPTNALDVQSLMFSAGVFTNMSGTDQ